MLTVFVLGPIALAVTLFVIPLEKPARAVTIAGQCFLLGYACHVFRLCRDSEIITRIGNFEGSMGIALVSDTLTSVFLMLAAFIFLIASIYGYSDGHSRLYRFFMLIWQSLLSGVFLANDVFNVFVLMEVATVVVAVLIMFKRDSRSMYDGMVYLMVNIVAMQFFLFGAGYIYKLAGTLDMTAAARALASIDKASLALPSALIFTALCLKCALMPLFSWLPKAHGTPGAPPAVSAVLSGLHIKSSIYLFIRFKDLFGALFVPEFFLLIGIITGIAGFLFALSQTDIKLILAYSTISQAGMIMIGLNLADPHSYIGSVYHILNHAVFKTALFMCAGIIAEVYGTRDLRSIRGVMRAHPLIGGAMLAAILGITGAPLFNGSISKYFIVYGAGGAVTMAVIFINLGTIITFIKFSTMLFGNAHIGRTGSQGDELAALPNEDGLAALSNEDGRAVLSNEDGRAALSNGDMRAALSNEDGLTMKKEPAAGCVHPPKKAAVLALGALCLFGGVFGQQTIRFLFGVEAGIDTAGYLEKCLLFAASVAAGHVLFKYFVDKHPFFKRILTIDLSFRQICASIGGFFAVALVVTRLFGA